MRATRHDPLRLDVAAFAADGASLGGIWPGHSLTRLAELQVPPQDLGRADVAWQASGERRTVPAGEAEVWLHLQAQAPVWLSCQRCLQPMAITLDLDRRLRFVHGESQAEALDADSEDDVLALSRSLDLRELVEDELLLSLPLVPRHDSCPQPLPVAITLEAHEADQASADPESADGPAENPAENPAEKRPNPFAALRGLKIGGGSDPSST